MMIILAFLIGVAAFAGWWLSRQRLMSKPWLEQGIISDSVSSECPPGSAAKIGLYFFLIVAGCLFALLVSAYSMRLQADDWWQLPVPRILWLNSGLLIMSSLILEGAKASSRHSDIERARARLVIAAFLTAFFLIGQILAWQQLNAEGYFVASNPASSFFYLITGLHGLHVAGGLIVLAQTIVRAHQTTNSDDIRFSIELCAIYWHFLLFIWLILFALLTGFSGEVFAICRQVFT